MSCKNKCNLLLNKIKMVLLWLSLTAKTKIDTVANHNKWDQMNQLENEAKTCNGSKRGKHATDTKRGRAQETGKGYQGRENAPTWSHDWLWLCSWLVEERHLCLIGYSTLDDFFLPITELSPKLKQTWKPQRISFDLPCKTSISVIVMANYTF